MDRVVLPGDRREEAITRRLGLATLLVFDLVLFAPLLVRGRVFTSHEFVRAHHPWRESPQGLLEAENPLLADPAASGETTLVRYRDFPRGFFWNPWVSSGAVGPFHLAQGFLSPFVAVPALALPEAWIETGILFLKFNFAFLAAYFFLRGRRFSDLASAAGAATWAFSTGQTVWGLWMQTSVSVTYPLLLAAVDRAFDRDRGARVVLFAAASFLLFVAGGFPHWILYGVFAAFLYFVFRAAAERARARRAAGRLALAASISLAILAPSIFASGRFVEASGYRDARRGMGAAYPLPLRHVRLYLLPEYQGTQRRADYRGVGWIPGDNYVETAVGVGIVAALLAAAGVFSRRRRVLVAWAVTLAAFVAIPLYGGGTILRAVGSLPFLDITLFARSKILIVLALGVLAACGTEELERLAVGSALRRTAIEVAPFLIAVPLAFLVLDFYPVSRPSEAVFRETPGIARLQALGSATPSRFAAAGWTLVPNVSEVFGLEDVRGHFLHEAKYRRLLSAADPNAFGRYGTYLLYDPRSLDPASPVLDLLNVATLAAPPGARLPTGSEVERRDAAAMEPPDPRTVRPDPDPARFPKIYDGPELALFARPSAFPRFWLVSRARPGGVEDVATADRATLATAVFTDRETAQRLAASEPARGSSGTVRVVRFGPENFELVTETPLPSLLVSSQKRFPPYWRLFLDGAPVDGFAANGLFLG
ncbi:MAG TPA: hypothetical protein VFW15_07065, partial [Thermoanaerobaculia bacterium]|nr:hypothetical protein [Thermoanaerobaculia bacterium]